MGDGQVTPEVVIYRLCQALSKDKNADSLTKTTRYALRMLSHCENTSVPNIDETALVEKIKIQLVKQDQMDAAVKIASLHRRLQQCKFLQNRWSVLYLLHSLSGKAEQKFSVGSLKFRQGLAAASTPVNGNFSNESITSSSGFGTAAPNSSRGLGTFSTLPSEIQTPNDRTSASLQSTDLSSRLGYSLTPAFGSKMQSSKFTPNTVVKADTQATPLNQSFVTKSSNNRDKVTEDNLIHQLLYVFQGIETKNIKHSTRENAFCLNSDVDVDKRDKQLVHKLCEMGWLHNRIKKYITTRNKDKAFGLVGKAFCAALQQELNEYYKLLSVLQSQTQQSDSEGNSPLTLVKLVVWTNEPMDRLKWIASLVDNCQGKKGGTLTSMVHSFMQTGDMAARQITRRILHVVSQPIFHFINKWIYEGELYDQYLEFFVAVDLSVGNERLWFDKYRMRTSMIPSFIKAEQAKKILLVGKSINFLRLVCRDRSPINLKKNQDSMKTLEDQSYGLEFASELKVRVDEAYRVTSSHLLHVLNDRYKLLTHLTAFRKFLLLGQGDFIRHLLDLLQTELDKAASLLYRHNLSGPVEAAVRASNAQFEDQDVLARLDFRLLEINPGDCGWDVFSLDYHVDPPLNTLITPDVMLVYLRVFNFLWRAKRMEYNLAVIWTKTMDQTRKLAPTLTNLQGVLHNCHTLAAEMVHFVHQMQYYIAFEVLECSWADLQEKLEQSKDLDEIITAHHDFLQSLMKRCLLDQPSSNLLMQLRSIFDQIVKFEHLQKDIYEQSNTELKARLQYERVIAESVSKGVWGVDVEKEPIEMNRRRDFRKTIIPEMRARLKVCACAYQDMVVMFLRQLRQENDANLRNLSWRLDFNEHYRSKDVSAKSTKKTGRKQVSVR
uniref:gamma-tubulin complex component 3 homolog n=1 Tax=Ciona intestinalis TaxID=7719 RepID=UPI000180BEB0|nr:gamma-tubulin complex component 3 homolog [Ciona intestinalis]|eukprot:XP_002131421.1 gamma-tubulin complex component 3 homolog [Ciona intestinalis]